MGLWLATDPNKILVGSFFANTSPFGPIGLLNTFPGKFHFGDVVAARRPVGPFHTLYQ